MDAIETFEHAGCTIELHYDEEPMSPAEWDNLGTIYALTRDADYQGFESPSATHGQAIEAMDRGGARLLRRYLRLCFGIHAVALQVSDYGSSGIRLSTDDGADDKFDGYNAYIAATPETIEMCGTPPEGVEHGLRQDLSAWKDYFEGNVYGYVVKCAGAHTSLRVEDGTVIDSVVDSCWGYYPDEKDGEPTDAASDAYRTAYALLDGSHYWGLANMLADAVSAAEHERDERERAANCDVATIGG